MAGACLPKVSIMYDLWIQPLLNQSKVLLKLCIKLITLAWNYSVCSQSS